MLVSELKIPLKNGPRIGMAVYNSVDHLSCFSDGLFTVPVTRSNYKPDEKTAHGLSRKSNNNNNFIHTIKYRANGVFFFLNKLSRH